MFVGKLSVFSAALEAGLGWLVVVAAVNTVASVFYYLRWIVPLFARAPGQAAAGALQPAGAWARAGAYSAGVASVLLGLTGGPAMAWLGGPLLPRP